MIPQKCPCLVITFGGLSGLPLKRETRRSALSCILGMCMGPGSASCSGVQSCQWSSIKSPDAARKNLQTFDKCTARRRTYQVRQKAVKSKHQAAYFARISYEILRLPCGTSTHTHTRGVKTWTFCLSKCIYFSFFFLFKGLPWAYMYSQAGTQATTAQKQATPQIITHSSHSDWNKQQAAPSGETAGEMQCFDIFSSFLFFSNLVCAPQGSQSAVERLLSQRMTTRGGGGGQWESRMGWRGFVEADEEKRRQRAVCVTSEWRDSEEEEVGRRMVFFGQPRAVEVGCWSAATRALRGEEEERHVKQRRMMMIMMVGKKEKCDSFSLNSTARSVVLSQGSYWRIVNLTAQVKIYKLLCWYSTQP